MRTRMLHVFSVYLECPVQQKIVHICGREIYTLHAEISDNSAVLRKLMNFVVPATFSTRLEWC